MAITLEEIQKLCMEGESNHLDYKRDQYPFVCVNNPEKSELLKDILAMANAFRKQTAYILIGVAQNPDNTGKITGICPNEMIDDSQMQEFINGKTNKVIVFSTYSVPVNQNKIIQVIEIPKQADRPYYTRKRLGQIKENEVLYRVGSSTSIATPDEIAKMGAEKQCSALPSIETFIYIPSQTTYYADDIIGYALDVMPEMWCKNGVGQIHIHDDDLLKKYSEAINFVKRSFKIIRIDIGLKNTSEICIEHPLVEYFISQCSQYCINELKHDPFYPVIKPSSSVPNSDNLLRPGQLKIPFQSLYFEINKSGTFTLEVTILGKNIPQPINQTFKFSVKLEKKSVDIDFVSNIYRTLSDENSFWALRENFGDKKENPDA